MMTAWPGGSRAARPDICLAAPSARALLPTRSAAVYAHVQADVDLIASEMELNKDVAERKLREHKGDVVQTLNTLVAA